MYQIDLNTATALDIIQRSMTCHPTLFRDALAERRREDYSYATRATTAIGGRSAFASGKAAQRAIDAIGNEDASVFLDDMGAGIIALNIACKLQCLPHYVRTASALRTWPQDEAAE